jgi:methyl-accepting chemotaxis protein
MVAGEVVKDRPKVRRRKILVRPRYQLLVAATILVFVVGYSLLLGVLIFYPIQREFAAARTQEQQFLTAYQILDLHKRFWPAVLGVGILVAIQSIFVIYRVVGPAYHIQRVIEGFTAGQYGMRVRLRRGDSLREFATAVNSLGESLLRREQASIESAAQLRVAVRELRAALPTVALPEPIQKAMGELEGLLAEPPESG